MEGIHTDFERLISWMVFETTEDFQKLLSRFENLPRQLQQIQQLMEEGVAAGIVNHAISMVGGAVYLFTHIIFTLFTLYTEVKGMFDEKCEKK